MVVGDGAAPEFIGVAQALAQISVTGLQQLN